MEIGKRISVVRRSKGISQLALSNKVYISPSYLNHMEKGRKNIQDHQLDTIAEALSVTKEYLLGENFKDDEPLTDEMLEWLELGLSLKKEGYSLIEAKEAVRLIVSTSKNKNENSKERLK